MGTQLDGSFEHPKHLLKLWVRKYLQFYAEKFCLSKPVTVSFIMAGKLLSLVNTWFISGHTSRACHAVFFCVMIRGFSCTNHVDQNMGGSLY